MKKYFLHLVVMIFLCSLYNNSLEIRPSSSKDVIITTIQAPSLENSIIGDQTEQDYIIILPSSYGISQNRYPVIYFLHGFSSTVNNFISIFSTLDVSIDVIFVLVSGRHNILGGSFYTNSPVSGNWEDFVIKDVVNYTDTNYRTIQETEYRGILGFSMGGYGSLNIGMKHPDIFGAMYAISPGLFDQNGLEDSQMNHESTINYYFEIEEDLNQIVDDDQAHTEYISMLDDLTFNSENRFILAYGSAFAPNPEKRAPYLDYLFKKDIHGNFVQNYEKWEFWENGFGGVDGEIQENKQNLLNLNKIGIEYSTNDYHDWIPRGCEYYSNQLTINNISHSLFQTEYGHGEYLSQRMEEYMVPFFSECFKDAETLTFNQDWFLLILIPSILIPAILIVSIIIVFLYKKRK